MDDLILTDEEKRIVLQLRRDDEERARMRALYLKRIRAACDYAEWMDRMGAGSTFSTFCDDFGYVADDDESRSVTYEVVTQVLKVAKGVV